MIGTTLANFKITAKLGEGGRTPIWSPSGDELFYLSLDGTRLLSVPIGQEPDTQIGREQTVLSGLPEGPRHALRRIYDVSPDGKRFLFLLPEEQPEAQEFVVITDWRDALRQAMQ